MSGAEQIFEFRCRTCGIPITRRVKMLLDSNQLDETDGNTHIIRG